MPQAAHGASDGEEGTGSDEDVPLPGETDEESNDGSMGGDEFGDSDHDSDADVEAKEGGSHFESFEPVINDLPFADTHALCHIFWDEV